LILLFLFIKLFKHSKYFTDNIKGHNLNENNQNNNSENLVLTALFFGSIFSAQKARYFKFNISTLVE
jgi:hypothetical protein